MASIVPNEKKESLSKRLATLDKISDTVNKKAGKIIIGRIGRTPEIEEKLRVKFVPTPSIDVNDAIGGGGIGGFPKSRMSIVSGLRPPLTAM